jgi:Ca-activated chloride channel homolog
MRFENPLALVYILWALPAIVLFFLLAGGSKIRAMNNFIRYPLWREVAESYNKRRDYAAKGLLALSVLLLLTAFARPQIGFSWRELQQKGLDIIFAIDVSKSMIAEDIMPNRLARVKIAAEDIISGLAGSRLGIVAFAGEAFLQCPLTFDYDAFRSVLLDIDTETIPTGGTSIGSAIFECIESFEKGTAGYKAIILVSDGEEHRDSAIDAARRAREANVKIFCLGVGSPSGAYLPVIDKRGQKGFIKDNSGRNILSRLNEELLKEVAFITGGSYIRSSPIDFGLDILYEQEISRMKTRQIKEKMTKKYNEYFQLPILIAIALLMLEMVINKKSL